MTERYDNFSDAMSASAISSTAYPFDWEHPVAWNQLEKYFQPMFGENTKKVLSMLMENSKSLEDFLSGAVVKTGGGNVYGNMTVSGNLTVGGSISYPPENIPLSPFPIGSVMQFAGSVAPTGWKFCNGSSFLIVDYQDLYDIIGTTYNTHCGSAAPAAGYFRVPNYSGRVVVATDSGDLTFNDLTDYGGAKEVTLTGQQSGIQYHNHTMSSSIDYFAPGGVPGVASILPGTANTSTNVTGHEPAISAHTNLQPYAVANYIIKY